MDTMMESLLHHPRNSAWFENAERQIDIWRQAYGHDNSKCSDPQCASCAVLRCPLLHPTHVSETSCVACTDLRMGHLLIIHPDFYTQK